MFIFSRSAGPVVAVAHQVGDAEIVAELSQNKGGALANRLCTYDQNDHNFFTVQNARDAHVQTADQQDGD